MHLLFLPRAPGSTGGPDGGAEAPGAQTCLSVLEGDTASSLEVLTVSSVLRTGPRSSVARPAGWAGAPGRLPPEIARLLGDETRLALTSGPAGPP